MLSQLLYTKSEFPSRFASCCRPITPSRGRLTHYITCKSKTSITKLELQNITRRCSDDRDNLYLLCCLHNIHRQRRNIHVQSARIVLVDAPPRIGRFEKQLFASIYNFINMLNCMIIRALSPSMEPI
uniref:AlNc14C154G7593 protein n=1 Tax=Albugo laibachii Nc14 TaxID=890382 RepID=F0WM88_9STRA|nr:AlNc14C154G7593 [Albugo laibachii Nc14]|eukprot:CCA22418.1 AlNc14C154G7593 [Albugo laibachii Nc14]